MESPTPTQSSDDEPLETDGYQITVDDGRESFFALSLECPTNDRAWLMSDVVCSLDQMR